MECGGCTFCCDILPVNWLKKPAMQSCIHCDNGCKIHTEKPAECTDFECEYTKSKKSHTDVRPDNLGIMFEKLTDNIILGTMHPLAEMGDIAKGQITHFCNNGLSVVVKKPNEQTNVYLAEGHTGLWIRKEFNEYLNHRYGSAKLHN